MPRIEGKTINELLRVEDITGAEILPMAVFNEEIGSYVTRGITLDNFFKTIYGMIKDAESSIAYIQEDMTAYVNELRTEDERLDTELDKTNVKVAYNAEDLVLMHEHYHRLSSYSYENIGELWEHASYGSSYAYENVGKLWASYADLQAYTTENAGELWEANEALASYAYEGIGNNAYAIVASYNLLDDSMQTSYEKLFDYISYVAAYAEGGTGELAQEVKELHAYSYENVGKLWTSYGDLLSYTYTGVGRNAYINLEQDIILAQHQNAISSLARNIAYESYVNTIQSGHINTIYYENSDDAFNNWADPDDDNVKPQP